MNGPWDLLVCPRCAADLELDCFEAESTGQCLHGLLSCTRCDTWYPVTDGVPRLLVPGPLRTGDGSFLARWGHRLNALLSRTPAGAPAAEGQAQVQRGFGYKWTRQSWWGMEGESAGVIDDWFLRRYGWNGPRVYDGFMSKRGRMLDAGCGLGRETLRMAASNPTSIVFGLELSDGVDRALQNARRRGVTNVVFVQADLMAPPFPANTFDFVLSEGVLHHTPDTRAALLAIARLVAEGGEIGFYVYRKKAPLREFADDYVRGLIQDRPAEEAWTMMEPLTRLGKALWETKAQVDVPEDVPVLGIKAGHYDVQRLIYYAMFKCYWNERLSFDENVHVNFDWYYPRFAWRHTESEVRDWLRAAGFTLVHEQVEEAGITMRAAKDPG